MALADGTRLNGTLVGEGQKYDVALVKVNPAHPLPAVTFGDSDSLKIGDRLMVVGNPYGLGISASSGIVSGLGRNLHLTNFDRFIQTDAALNHGNSGGPVFALDGKVVGMSTALYNGGVSNGGSIGIGFAIPSSIMQDLCGLLRKYGYLRIGSIGADVRALNRDMAAALGIAPQGVIVAQVDAHGPAAKLLQDGDVITALDGTTIDSPDSFYRTVAAGLGKTFEVKIWRAGRNTSVSILAAQWAEEKPSQEMPLTPSQNESRHMHFGINLAPITPYLRKQFHLPADLDGLIVTAVQPDTPGATAGFSVGDVVERAEAGSNVQLLTPNHAMSPDAAADMLKQNEDRLGELKKQGWPSILVLVHGSDGVRFVTMSLADWVQ